jgi:hypothetical protein
MPIKDQTLDLTLPTLEKFKKDTYITFGFRSHDHIITRIDELLVLYHQPKTQQTFQNDYSHEGFLKTYILGDLFFTTDYWLKLASRKDKSIHTGRTKGVEALYRAIVAGLCQNFGVEVNELPNELELHYGRELHGYGQAVDYNFRSGKVSGTKLEYLKRAEASKYEIEFRQGVAYRWKKYKLIGWRKVQADTTIMKSYTPNFIPGFCGFVMSMSRDLYMSQLHTAGADFVKTFFHSSYLSGSTVMCAGSLRIEHGRVTGICNDSGHYRPTIHHLVNVLECLRMHGVNLGTLEVYLHNSDKVSDFSKNETWKANEKFGSGLDLLMKSGNAARLLQARKEFKAHREDSLKMLKILKEDKKTSFEFDKKL